MTDTRDTTMAGTDLRERLEEAIREALPPRPHNRLIARDVVDAVMDVLRPELTERDGMIRYWRTCRDSYASENEELIRQRNAFRAAVKHADGWLDAAARLEASAQKWDGLSSSAYDEEAHTAKELRAEAAELRRMAGEEEPAPVDPNALLRNEAALIRAHCPDHLDNNSAEGSWMACHCDVADDMERRAGGGNQLVTGTTADKANYLGMTPEEYRAYRHRAAIGQIKAALPGLYAMVGLRVEAALVDDAAGLEQTETRQATKPVVAYSGKGRVFCPTCPRPADENVPLTVDSITPGECCRGCGRDLIDVAMQNGASS